MTFKFYLPKNGIVKNIHLTISDKQEKKLYSFRTSLKIEEENWDKVKQRPKNIYLKSHKKISHKLDNIKIKLFQYILNKKQEKKSIKQRDLSQEVKKICCENIHDLPNVSLLFLMFQYIEVRKELICNSTYKRYKVFYNLLERYEGYKMERLHIDTINFDFINDFVIFGREEEYSENTIFRTIHFVKTILNYAERKGIRTAVRELEIRREKQQREIVTLNETEIIKIKSTEVPQELQAAKDWLLISCYTGQRFSDFMHFGVNQLKYVNGKSCLSFKQQKTQKQILLPLHPTVLNTIERNGNNFPKVLDIQHYNNDIKEIARLASLNEPVKARKRIGYRTKDVYAEKWEILSSHIGRRSFATNFFGKIPTPLLMAATGHSSEQIFMRYINPVDKEKITTLGNYFEKMYEERLMIV